MLILQISLVYFFEFVKVSPCLAASIDNASFSIISDFPPALLQTSLVLKPYPWEVTLFEHGNYEGRQITLGSDSHTCQSLNNSKLCTWGNGDDCTFAAQSVSSIKLN